MRFKVLAPIFKFKEKYIVLERWRGPLHTAMLTQGPCQPSLEQTILLRVWNSCLDNDSFFFFMPFRRQNASYKNIIYTSAICTKKLILRIFCVWYFSSLSQRALDCEDRDGPDVKIKCNKQKLLPLPRVKHGAHFGGAISSPSVSPRASCWVSCLCLRRAPHPASLPSATGFSAHPGRSLPQAGSLFIILVSDWNFVNSCFILSMQLAITIRRTIMSFIYVSRSPVKQPAWNKLVNQTGAWQLPCCRGSGV